MFLFHQFDVYTGKELNDPRVLTDVGDVPVQEIRDCGIDDDRLMNVISDSVKIVMEEVSVIFQELFCENSCIMIRAHQELLYSGTNLIGFTFLIK